MEKKEIKDRMVKIARVNIKRGYHEKEIPFEALWSLADDLIDDEVECLESVDVGSGKSVASLIENEFTREHGLYLFEVLCRRMVFSAHVDEANITGGGYAFAWNGVDGVMTRLVNY